MDDYDYSDLTGRAVLITGASSGLGAEFARAAAKAGAAVALCARRRDRLDALVREIESTGGKAVAITMDVTDDDSIRAGFDEAEAALGPLFSVVANSGISGTGGPALATTTEDFRAVLDVNLTGAFATVREAANRMIAAGSADNASGRIVIIASLAAEVVIEGVIAYNASKAGVKMLGRAFAKAVAAKGINVNTVSPGYVLTEINADFSQTAEGQAMVQYFPRKRMMVPSDLAPMVLFLLSDASRTITGRDFVVDDGQV